MPLRRSFRPHFRRRVATFGRRRRFVSRAPFRRKRVMRRVTRPISRRRVLRVASRKKSDAMIMTSGSPPAIAPLTTAIVNRSLFSPTARAQYSGVVGNDHNREAQETFARGYREQIIFKVNSSAEWYWRRIVFTFKGDVYIGNGTAADQPFADVGASGMTRYFNTLSAGASTALTGVLYQGTVNIDWADEKTAKIDRNRVRILHDESHYFRPEVNSQGHEHRFKRWYPLNARLVYNDEESGKGDTQNYVSTQGPRSLGDVYIYDIISPEIASGGLVDNITVSVQGEYYWHER